MGKFRRDFEGVPLAFCCESCSDFTAVVFENDVSMSDRDAPMDDFVDQKGILMRNVIFFNKYFWF